jgi:hypothetical protein
MRSTDISTAVDAKIQLIAARRASDASGLRRSAPLPTAKRAKEKKSLCWGCPCEKREESDCWDSLSHLFFLSFVLMISATEPQVFHSYQLSFKSTFVQYMHTYVHNLYP